MVDIGYWDIGKLAVSLAFHAFNKLKTIIIYTAASISSSVTHN
jgi:hypothetical protein